MALFRRLLELALFGVLTLLTQLGGLAWLLARWFPQRIMAFLVAYSALSLAALWIAPHFGRTALSCTERGPLQVQSWIYCALNRTYVTPQTKAVLTDLAEEMAQQHPGTITLVLDANFPFITGFPLLRHLSHDDGEKADLAFFYQEDGVYQPGATRSPIGYFAFEQGASECPPIRPTLRWDLAALQPLWRSMDLDRPRMRTAMTFLAEDMRVGKVFLEPHLQTALTLSHQKIRFQGCRAARHDDHIHLQL